MIPTPWDILDESPWVVPMLELVGVREVPGDEHHPTIVAMLDLTPVGGWTDNDEQAWCGAAKTYSVLEARRRGALWVPEPPDNPHRARSWLKWGVRAPRTRGATCVLQAKQRGAARRTGSARGGYHVGDLLDWKRGWVQLVSGNKGNKQGIDWYPLSRWNVRGYRRPL